MSAGQPEPVEDKLVTIARFLEPVRVQMAKGLLESVGIECFVQGENANAMLAFAFRARLQVRASEAETAREVLRSVTDEEPGTEGNPLETDGGI